MWILADTNVLLRRLQPTNPDYAIAVDAIAHLVSKGDTVCYTPQNIAELWNVATRPEANNGLGLPIQAVAAEALEIERSLTLLTDLPAAYLEWKRLVVHYSVIGTKVHDTRLVAAMNVHNVTHILTFDRDDFTRFGVSVLHPSAVIP